MKRIFYFFFFLVQINYAQKNVLDNVTVEELELKQHSKDPSASAVILFKRAKTKFEFRYKEGFQSTTEVELKIKIFKKEGLNWANFNIPFYVGYKELDDEIIKIDKANTYNLVDAKISKEKVPSSSIFTEKVNDYWSSKKVFFPKVKEGSIIELKYTFKSQNISELPEFQFQYDIPVDYAECISDIPEFYIYKVIKNGFVNIEFDEKLKNANTNYVDRYQQSHSFNYKNIVGNIRAKDVPALLSEDYVNNINNYYGKIQFELQTIRMPEEKVKHISKTWNDVALSVFKEKLFGKELEKSDYFLADLRNTVIGTDPEIEKLEKIFSFLQKRMTWNDKYNYLPNKPLDEIYIDKIGSSGEINLILVSMLRIAGLNANPVLITTRDSELALFPNRSKINSLLVNVKIDNKDILCDASSKFTTPNLVSLNHTNNSGQIINKEGNAEEIKILPDRRAREITNIAYSINEDFKIKGKIKKANLGYSALEFRNKYHKVSEESYLQNKEKELDGAIISNYSVVNKSDLKMPIVENFDFEASNSLEKIGDKIYVKPLLFFSMNVNPFKRESRNCPIEFSYPKSEKVAITFDIPDGFLLESLPAPVNFSFLDGALTYLFNIIATGKQIQIESQFDIKNHIINQIDYSDLKVFFNEILKKQSEKIVLKKV